jgi:NADH dehydrogenase
VILLDFAPQVLTAFGDRLSDKAARRLREIDVEVQLGAKVVGMDRDSIDVEDTDGTRRRIPAFCKIWAAGVQASPLAGQLAEQSGAEVDRAGRVLVEPDLTLRGHPEVHVVGDMASLNDYPGVAQVAIQGARHAAKAIRTGEHKPFAYKDKGSMATVSRFHAVASIKGLRFSGFIAWLLWLAVHIVYIVGFKSRVTTVLHWAVSFLGRGRSERVATEQQVLARLALEEVGPGFISLDTPAPTAQTKSRRKAKTA